MRVEDPTAEGEIESALIPPQMLRADLKAGKLTHQDIGQMPPSICLIFQPSPN